MASKIKIVALLSLLGLLLSLIILGSSQASAYQVLNTEQSTEIITEGVVLNTFRQVTDEGPLNIYVLKVNLASPYIKVDTLIGEDGTFEKNQAVTAMANRSGAVAALNGDFFQMKESKRPIGITVQGGELVASPARRIDMYGFGITKVREPLLTIFGFWGQVIAENGNTFPLSGINKPSYLLQTGVSSDVYSLNMYTPRWGKQTRNISANLQGVVEVTVQGGIVQEIRTDQTGTSIPNDGFVLAGHGPAADFLLQNCPVGSRVEVSYKVEPRGDELFAAVGGQALLVKEGHLPPYFTQEIKGKVARSAAGISLDGKELYLVAVEGGPTSRGMTQKELAEFLISLGVWQAVNLDGGGSTTIAARHLGDTEASLINHPQKGSQRLVPNAIGIFTNTPPGSLKGLVIKGPATVIAGTYSQYQAKGYDDYYNPYPVTPDEVFWSVYPAIGSFEKNLFIPYQQGGFATIQASSGTAKGALNIQVLGPEDLDKLIVEPVRLVVKAGQTSTLTLKVQTKNGKVMPIVPGYATWIIPDGVGRVQNGIFTANDKLSLGQLEVTFQRLSVSVPVLVCSDEPVMPQFKDTTQHWAKEAINDLATMGIAKGFPDGTYQPDAPVTRSQFVLLISKIFQWLSPEKAFTFRDSLPTWAEGAISAAVAKNIIFGYPDGTFQPNKEITRAEAAIIINRCLDLKEAMEVLSYQDDKIIPQWARKAIYQVTTTGVLKGSNGYFRPFDRLTRAEAATLLRRVLQLYSRD